MSPEVAVNAAQAILKKRAGQFRFNVLVDSPGDCRPIVTAFRKLRCSVEIEQDGAKLVITRQL